LSAWKSHSGGRAFDPRQLHPTAEDEPLLPDLAQRQGADGLLHAAVRGALQGEVVQRDDPAQVGDKSAKLRLSPGRLERGS